jgi:hypothetical protein
MGSESEFSSLLLNSSSSSEKSAAARSVGEIGVPRGRRRWEAVSRRRDNRRGASWASVPCGDSTMIVLDMHDQQWHKERYGTTFSRIAKGAPKNRKDVCQWVLGG